MSSNSRLILLLCGTIALALCLEGASAFSYTQMQSRSGRKAQTIPSSFVTVRFSSTTTSSSSLLKSATVDSQDSPVVLNDEDAMAIWTRAKDYAFEEICEDYHKEYVNLQKSLREARLLLKQSINIQSGCVAGTVTSKLVCGGTNSTEAAMVIAQLRHKIQRLEAIEQHAKHPNSSPPSESVVPMVATELALGAMLVVFVVFWTTLEIGNLQGDEHIPPAHIYDWWSSFVHHFL